MLKIFDEIYNQINPIYKSGETLIAQVGIPQMIIANNDIQFSDYTNDVKDE